VSYAPDQAKPIVAEDALKQLLQLLSSDHNKQLSLKVSTDGTQAVAETDLPVLEQRVNVRLLATEFADAITKQADANPLDVLMRAYDGLDQGLTSHNASPSKRDMQKKQEVPAVDDAHPCLLLLRHAKTSTGSQPPLVIAHSLLGDHRGYGRLWKLALHESDVYTLRHRGLTGADAFTLDVDGAMHMAREYATALVAVFASRPFDLMGASFGAVLALHVWHAAAAARGSPRRLVLIDPPPAVPSELPVPKMLSGLRTAAMGVLLMQLKFEMGASVWEQFPQLKTLPEQALACFVAAQCLPEGASRDDLIAEAERLHRLLRVYQQCRHAFHTLSASVKAVTLQPDGSPTVLMALSSERWPTFREMFPGIKEDAIDEYGQAAVLKLPGKHLAMVGRCISNQDSDFTGAVERFLSDSFPDAWWWAEHLPKAPVSNDQLQRTVPPAAGLRADDLMPLLSALAASTAAPTDCEASGPGMVDTVEVAVAVQDVAYELLGSKTSADAPLMEAGLDSLAVVEFRSRLSSQLSGVKLPDTLVFDFPTLRQIEAHMSVLLVASSSHPQSARRGDDQKTTQDSVRMLLSSLASNQMQDPIASPTAQSFANAAPCVFGASCKLGGGVRGVTSFHDAARTGHDAVSSVLPGRWNTGSELDIKVQYGSFLPCIDLFDQRFFGLPPAEAEIMDPHQRLALEEGYAALHAAALNRGSLMGSATGVFGGIWASDYSAVLPRRGAAGRGPFAVTATGCAMLVGRLSYTLGLQGPSIAFDTACSSSLSALQAALYAHTHQDSHTELVLGVNIMCDGNLSLIFAAARMTSPLGKSHTFDARADGYARGEACCCVALLPRLESRSIRCDAGVVRQDGKSASLTAPNGTAQKAMLRAALKSAGRSSRGAFVLESHGTGTGLGDPIESRAMCVVREEPHLMSVMGCKANVGHTEPSAGATGLLQLVSTMRQSVTCPNAQLRIINSRVMAAMGERCPSLAVQSKTVYMSAAEVVGGVSSFGLNGTIAHAVMSLRRDDQYSEMAARAVVGSCKKAIQPSLIADLDVPFHRCRFTRRTLCFSSTLCRPPTSPSFARPLRATCTPLLPSTSCRSVSSSPERRTSRRLVLRGAPPSALPQPGWVCKASSFFSLLRSTILG
jgi:3-oxoacyl-(acyl-carrier-protein) synthase/thioesterase domain-containing protein